MLSWDLVEALVAAQPLPAYRLLDPGFGIHLCGPPGCCVLQAPVTPAHDERVRPYRPIPIFRPDTLVQHYLAPEEMKPFYSQVRHCARAGQGRLQLVRTCSTRTACGAPVTLQPCLLKRALRCSRTGRAARMGIWGRALKPAAVQQCGAAV